MSPFLKLTWEALIFLEEKTRNQEPWCGFGFATSIHNAIVSAMKEKYKEFHCKYPKGFLFVPKEIEKDFFA